MFYLLLLAALFQAVWSTSANVQLAINRHERLAVANVTGSVAVIGAAALLVPRFGLAALGAVQLAVDVALAAYLVWLALVYLEDRPRSLARAVLEAPAAGWSALRRAVRRARAPEAT
jgi:O-antigen/teichoic acid export membrane protein